MGNWKYYEDIDFSDQSIVRYNIDTRDFYCAIQTKAQLEQMGENDKLIAKLDTTAIDKYPATKYYHTEQEVKDLIERSSPRKRCSATSMATRWRTRTR